jgi:hypothetical protein
LIKSIGASVYQDGGSCVPENKQDGNICQFAALIIPCENESK